MACFFKRVNSAKFLKIQSAVESMIKVLLFYVSVGVQRADHLSSDHRKEDTTCIPAAILNVPILEKTSEC